MVRGMDSGIRGDRMCCMYLLTKRLDFNSTQNIVGRLSNSGNTIHLLT